MFFSSSSPSDGQEVLRAGRIVVGIAIGLVALGLVMVYSSTSAQTALRMEAQLLDDTGVDALGSASVHLPYSNLMRQLRWVIIAAAAGIFLARVPLEWLRGVARPMLIGTLLLLAATLVIGTAVNQSRRWLPLGFASFQPSELLKISALIFVSFQLASRERAREFGAQTPLGPTLLPVGIGVVLVLLAPDMGTALFLVAEIVVLLGLAGVRPARLVPLALVSMPAIVLYAYSRFAHVSKRWELFINEPKDGSQVQEGLVALGSGGITGVGLGEGTQKLGFIAESQTDFIFTVIGEELGFLGCASVVLAFMAFVWYGRKVAWHARILGPHAFYLAAGATFIVAFQALVNIAVVTATVPTKGVSLPFISVGGSNLLMSALCVAITHNVARRTAAASTGDPWA